MRDESRRISSLLPPPSSLFPDPRSARGDMIAIGADLHIETLRDAYRHGIFPWPHERIPLPWFSPRRRTVLFFDQLHVGRTLRRAQSGDFRFTIDQAFRDVIESCAVARRGDEVGTWIGPEIVDAYTRLHRAGEAHRVEAWS